MLCLTIVYLQILNIVFCEDFNLLGEPGQAYAIEVNVGHPEQILNIIVDTGSTTMALASSPIQKSDKYFYCENSSSFFNTEKQVQAKYSQGMWMGQVVSDFIKFPTLTNTPEIRSNFALIKKSQKFFTNGSGWQGLLGLAYLPVGAKGEDIVVESWLDSVERYLGKPISFALTLCGVKSAKNATHYGRFEILDDNNDYTFSNYTYRTPILIKRWYEVGVVSVRVIKSADVKISEIDDNKTEPARSQDPDSAVCEALNQQKSIVDSGTTNIKLPDELFRQVVDELRNEMKQIDNSTVFTEEFWYQGEAVCWPQPQEWSSPWLAVDLLSEESDYHYFTLEIPPQNYMRLMSARNHKSENSSISEFCYKFGLESGGRDTVLGYTAMEGFEVIFNRSADWIGFRTANCGHGAKITGPHVSTESLLQLCRFTSIMPYVPITIEVAKWILCAVCAVAACVLLYILAPYLKKLCMRRLRRPIQLRMSRNALLEQSVIEST